jgi:hypothetical protein
VSAFEDGARRIRVMSWTVTYLLAHEAFPGGTPLVLGVAAAVIAAFVLVANIRVGGLRLALSLAVSRLRKAKGKRNR